MLAHTGASFRLRPSLLPPAEVADREEGDDTTCVLSAGIGLAKISLISLSEIVAKCNASPRRRTRAFRAIDGSANAGCCRKRGRKKDGRDVKIKRNARQGRRGDGDGTREADSEKGGERARTRAQERERARIRARVSNILFLPALAKLTEENEASTRTSQPLLFFLHPPRHRQ